MRSSLRPAWVSATVEGVIRELRPRQWYKQGVMFFGIVFSRNLLNLTAWVDLLIGVAAFTAIVGTTYLVNDVLDRKEDRNHPEKQERPIASGQVSVPTAISFAGILAIAGLAAAFSLGRLFFIVILAYLAQSALYSYMLKDVLFVDVILVAIGFVLRAIAGVIAIDVFLSPWLIVATFLLALVLALGKRRHELEFVTDPADTRQVLSEYSKSDVDQLLVVSMATLLMAYSLYTFSRTDPTMMATLPFAFFGVFRYHHLVHTTEIAGQPEYLFTDYASMINLALWGLTAIAVLYDMPTRLLGVVL